jgi:hypothetical protein
VSSKLHAPITSTPREENVNTHSTGGSVNPRVGMQADEKRRISCICPEWKPSSSNLGQEPVTILGALSPTLQELYITLHFEVFMMLLHSMHITTPC